MHATAATFAIALHLLTNARRCGPQPRPRRAARYRARVARHLPDRPDQRRLRAMARHHPPEHISGWVDVIRGDNPGKKAIARYARSFVLQHFWAVLLVRHDDALKGALQEVMRAFTSYLFPAV